jgi:hypothetical protein
LGGVVEGDIYLKMLFIEQLEEFFDAFFGFKVNFWLGHVAGFQY